MRDYELILLIKPEVTEDNLPAVLEKVKQMVAAGGGTIAETAIWGRKKLAYPIASAVEATYILNRLQMDPKGVAHLEANLGLTDEVLRFLTVRAEQRKRPVAASARGEESKEQGDGQSK